MGDVIAMDGHPLEQESMQVSLLGAIEHMLTKDGDEFDRGYLSAFCSVYERFFGEKHPTMDAANETLTKWNGGKKIERIRSAQIHILPGVERRDLGTPVDDKAVLLGAINAGAQDVIIVGKQRKGEIFMAASDCNMDAVAGKLFYAATWLSTRKVEQS